MRTRSDSFSDTPVTERFNERVDATDDVLVAAGHCDVRPVTAKNLLCASEYLLMRSGGPDDEHPYPTGGDVVNGNGALTRRNERACNHRCRLCTSSRGDDHDQPSESVDVDIRDQQVYSDRVRFDGHDVSAGARGKPDSEVPEPGSDIDDDVFWLQERYEHTEQVGVIGNSCGVQLVPVAVAVRDGHPPSAVNERDPARSRLTLRCPEFTAHRSHPAAPRPDRRTDGDCAKDQPKRVTGRIGKNERGDRSHAEQHGTGLHVPAAEGCQTAAGQRHSCTLRHPSGREEGLGEQGDAKHRKGPCDREHTDLVDVTACRWDCARAFRRCCCGGGHDNSSSGAYGCERRPPAQARRKDVAAQNVKDSAGCTGERSDHGDRPTRDGPPEKGAPYGTDADGGHCVREPHRPFRQPLYRRCRLNVDRPGHVG
jgi:hypothetical protein